MCFIAQREVTCVARRVGTRASRLHFEGRNVDDITAAITSLAPYRVAVDSAGLLPLTPSGAHVVISVELEKQRPGVTSLIPLADVVFLSREFASLLGLHTPLEMIAEAAKTAKHGYAPVWCRLGHTRC